MLLQQPWSYYVLVIILVNVISLKMMNDIVATM